MKSLTCSLAALAVILTAAPAFADEIKPVQPPKDRKICRSAVGTGSIMARRVCRTKAEWEALDSANLARTSRELDRYHDTSGTSTSRP